MIALTTGNGHGMTTKHHDESTPTRGSLLSRLKDWDDQESWRDFFNTYWKLIYGVALKAGLTETEAQDVVQDTIVTVAKKIKAFTYDPALGSFKGWLYTVTRSRIEDHRRKRPPVQRPRPRQPGDTRRTATIERIPDPASLDLDAVWDAEWRANLVETAMQRIRPQVKPKHYRILDLHVVRGWAAEKVAETVGVSRGQVYLVKLRLLPLLKRQIKRLETRLV